LSGSGQVYTYGTVQWQGNGEPGTTTPATIVQDANAEYAKHVVETPSRSTCNPYTVYWHRGSATGCQPGTRAEAWRADFADYIWKIADANISGLGAASSSFQAVELSELQTGGQK
jgi:hypothetical protein